MDYGRLKRQLECRWIDADYKRTAARPSRAARLAPEAAKALLAAPRKGAGFVVPGLPLGEAAPVPMGAGVVELTKIGVVTGTKGVGTPLEGASDTGTGAVPMGTGTTGVGTTGLLDSGITGTTGTLVATGVVDTDTTGVMTGTMGVETGL